MPEAEIENAPVEAAHSAPTPADVAAKTQPVEPVAGEVGDAGKAAIKKERDARADLERQLAESKSLQEQLAEKVREFEDRDKTDQQRLADEVEALKQKVADKDAEIVKAQHASLRAEVAAEMRVPPSRIHGTTREELAADAEAYLSEIAEAAARDAKKTSPTKPPTPSAGLKSGASTTGAHSTDPKERAVQALRAMRQSGA